MKKNLLIGESGGSKTDWVLLKADGTSTKGISPSLHPSNWGSYDWALLLSVWKNMEFERSNTVLDFYGAGCNMIEKANELREHFESLEFPKVHVFGDLKAAGLATLGSSNGYVAILGSGSVLIEFQNENAQNYFGGLGRELGDEGGGYYFGKMVLTAFKEGSLSPIQKSLIKAHLSATQVSQVLLGKEDDELKLQMASLLSSTLFEFQDFHKNNFQLFFDSYVDANLPKESTIHFVGSYAFYHQAILKEVCELNQCKFGEIVERPIDRLIEYYKNKPA